MWGAGGGGGIGYRDLEIKAHRGREGRVRASLNLRKTYLF